MSFNVHLKSTSFGRFLNCYSFEGKDVMVDIKKYLQDCQTMIEAVLEVELDDMRALKFWLCMTVEFIRSEPGFEVKKCYFPNNQAPVLNVHDIKTQLIKGFEKIREAVESFEANGSGWVILNISQLDLYTTKYQPLKGSSYVELPEHIRKKGAVVNVKNLEDNQCFKWCILAHLHPAPHHAERVSHYYDFEDELDFSGITYPVELKAMDKFCQQNPTISVNVYSCEGPIHPIRLSHTREVNHVNLLYYQGHYSLIKNFDRLLGDQNRHRSRKYFCDMCLFPFYDVERLRAHAARCLNPDLSTIQMPNAEILSFQNVRKMVRRPLVVYADFECLLRPVESCAPNPNRSHTEKLQRHVPCAFGAQTVLSCCGEDVQFDPYEQFTGPDCVQKFLDYLQHLGATLNARVNRISQPHLTGIEEDAFQASDLCWICEKELCDDRVRDHCHTCGKYRGAAHASCNSQLQSSNELTVVFHNLRRYDGHILITELGDLCAKAKNLQLGCIAKSSEDYISFSLIRRAARKRGRDANATKPFKITFIDSCQFLLSSLDRLVKDLDPQDFRALESYFPADKVNLLKRKGIFPYDYLSDWDKLLQTEPPSQQDFFNVLTRTNVSTENYQHMLNVWNAFEVASLGDYMELYLKTDVLLLCDVFEKFRKFGMSCFGLDPCHYYTLPSFGWDSCLKLTKVELELISDPDMYQFFEPAVRGGVSTITHRHATANNPYLPGFDPSKPTNYIVYLDANNLYGWAMTQKLPVRDFHWMTEDEIASMDVMSIDPNGDTGFLLEVDLEYPQELHDRHNDFPLAAERMTVDSEMLSPHCRNLLGDAKHFDIPKLVPNLHDKSCYVVHIANLQFYLKHGLILKKIHRGVRFFQDNWMVPYIDFNTNRRRQAISALVKNFHKLLNNGVFGKTMENVRKYIELELVTCRRRLLKVTKSPEFKRAIIFTENLAGCLKNRKTIELNKPIYVGVAVLELSKLLMCEFHYEHIVPQYEDRAKILMTDTDSFMYEIQTADVYRDMLDAMHRFDTSQYPDDHFLRSELNKMRVGKMKDESAGKPISEFVGLRSKMYSFCCGGDEHKRAKGVKKDVVQRFISHADYVTALRDGNPQYHEMRMIRSFLHQLYTVKLIKKSLASFDDKRYVLNDGINTLAYGHYSTRTAIGGAPPAAAPRSH